MAQQSLSKNLHSIGSLNVVGKYVAVQDYRTWRSILTQTKSIKPAYLLVYFMQSASPDLASKLEYSIVLFKSKLDRNKYFNIRFSSNGYIPICIYRRYISCLLLIYFRPVMSRKPAIHVSTFIFASSRLDVVVLNTDFNLNYIFGLLNKAKMLFVDL